MGVARSAAGRAPDHKAESGPQSAGIREEEMGLPRTSSISAL